MSQRHSWSTDLAFDSLGTVVRIRSTDAQLGNLIGRLFGHFPPTDRSSDIDLSIVNDEAYFGVDKGQERIADRVTRDKALVRVMSIVNEESVFGASPFIVHAGAVARDGGVVVFPASAHAGKSTLVAAALMEGFDYVTDEALLIADSGDVLTYPKALWLTPESLAAISVDSSRLMARLDDRYKSPLLPEELGARVAEPPLSLAHVVVLQRDGSSPSLKPLGPTIAATELLTHAFNRYDQPREWFKLTASLSRKVSVWHLRYGDAIEAAGMLRSAL